MRTLNSNDTICALSSAPGRAGVAVVRVSGPRAKELAETIAGPLVRPRTAALRTLREPRLGQEIDRAIILWFAGPSSFTGEDVVELHLHGGRAVVASVLAALRGLGCRLAEPGEFAQRAFANGKIDLAEAEGLADLIDAETEAQRAQAMAQASGVMSRLYESWRQELVTALALMEASIDFSDEPDVAADAVAQAGGVVADLASRIRGHLEDGRRGEILREGFRVVLAGPPNAGKSSLLNALARREAAIVSPEAGTTRDVIEVRLDLAGIPVVVCDTAGIREAEGDIEREGIRRTLAHAREAQLVVWMTDAREPVSAVPADINGGVLIVRSKTDLVELSLPATPQAGVEKRTHGLSVVTGEGMAALVDAIAAAARARVGHAREDAVITQARHREALEDCAHSLQVFTTSDMRDVELRAEDLRSAANALGRITGRVDAEMVLDQVFGRFCIGK